MLHSTVIVALTFLNASALYIHSQAAQIQFSWSGQLVPYDATDPWQIGPQGKAFELTATVASAAHDLEQNVDVAIFNIDHASLSLDGQVIPYVANGFLEFDDDWSDLLDFMVFFGEFIHLGQTVEIGSLVAFPTTTFQFTQFEDMPPAFASIANMDKSIYGARPYTAIVPTGNLVEVVPEPGMPPFNTAVALIFTDRRKRRRRCA